MSSFEEILDKDGFICYTNVGVSMMPLIRQGKDIMTIKKAEGNYKKYDSVLFIRPNIEGRGRYVLHRILKENPDGTFWIVGDNCVSGENVKKENIIGIMTELKRGKKEIKVDDFLYKMYVYLWCAPYHLRIFLLKTKIFIMRKFRGLKRRLLGKKNNARK